MGIKRGREKNVRSIPPWSNQKNSRLCSEEEVFEHANNDEYSEKKVPELYWKGSQGRERKITGQIFPYCLFPFTQACRVTTKITQRSFHRMCENYSTRYPYKCTIENMDPRSKI
jgi:hypothetical protein